MKKLLVFSTLLAVLLVGCDKNYSQIEPRDLGEFFTIHSSPTFLGFSYDGSDDEFHYFTSQWRYEGDRKVKVPRADLAIAREFEFGSDTLGLTVLDAPDSGPVFCEIDGRPVYERVEME